MKRWKKIVIGLLLLVLAAFIGLTVWQWENIRALYMFVVNDSETITKNLEESRSKQQETLKDYNVTVQPPTTEQSSDLLDGKVSPEEVKDSLGISQELAKPQDPSPDVKREEQTQPEEQQPTEEKPEDPDKAAADRKKQIDDLISQCVAELYACEVDLMARLGEMKKAAVAEWNGLRPEQRTKDKKLEIGLAGLSQCYEMEVEIDQRVLDIIAKYREKLTELESDTSVLDELWVYYCEEKASQKAYYLDKYLD